MRANAHIITRIPVLKCNWSFVGRHRYTVPNHSLFPRSITTTHSPALKATKHSYIAKGASNKPSLSMVDSNIVKLCDAAKSQWPSKLGSEGWYIALVSSLITCHKLDETRAAVLHIARSSFPTTEERLRLFVRLKDMLMKQSQLVGIPVIIMALSEIVKVETELDMPVPSREEQERTSHYSKLEATKELDQRGEQHMRKLYQSNLEEIISTWKMHQIDFEWLEKRVIYGLFLSDHEILDMVDTSIVNVSSIMCQGFMPPTMWHIRGLRRLGHSVEDVEKVCDIIKMVADFSGKDTSNWLRAKDVDISG